MGFLGDVGNALSSTASAAGNLAENAVDSVVDTAQDALDGGIDWAQDGIHVGQGWLCQTAGTVGCGAGNILGGLLDGGLSGLQDTVDKSANVTRDLAGIGGSLLRLNLTGVQEELVNFGLDAANLGLVGARWGAGGYLVGGILDAYERDALRNFVSERIDANFSGERRDRARQRIGLDDGTFGLPLTGLSRVFVLDSDTVPLAQWHREGRLDLYAMAGLLSFESFDVYPLPTYRTVVKLVGADGRDRAVPVGRLQISRFIESDGRLWRRAFGVCAVRQALAEHLATAKDKCRQLGIRINWNDGERFAWFRSYTQYEVTDETDFRDAFRPRASGRGMGGRQGAARRVTWRGLQHLALGTFNTSPGKFGQTLGRSHPPRRPRLRPLWHARPHRRLLQ